MSRMAVNISVDTRPLQKAMKRAERIVKQATVKMLADVKAVPEPPPPPENVTMNEWSMRPRRRQT